MVRRRRGCERGPRASRDLTWRGGKPRAGREVYRRLPQPESSTPGPTRKCHGCPRRRPRTRGAVLHNLCRGGDRSRAPAQYACSFSARVVSFGKYCRPAAQVCLARSSWPDCWYRLPSHRYVCANSGWVGWAFCCPSRVSNWLIASACLPKIGGQKESETALLKRASQLWSSSASAASKVLSALVAHTPASGPLPTSKIFWR